MDENITDDDRDAGLDMCGITDDVSEHDAKTGTEAEMAKMDIDDTPEHATTDAKMFDLLPRIGKRETKQPTVPVVDQAEDNYDMTHRYRGHALIVNNEKFSRKLKDIGLTDRAGTNIDEYNLREQLYELGFNVRSISNRTAELMKEACIEMASKDHSRCDCFICVILSHGDEGVVYGRDKTIEIKELSRPFKGDMCPTLVGKPKIFIIQACRGYQTDPGVAVDVMDAKGKAPTEMDVPLEPNIIKLPIEADFLFAYSTVPGFYSWRNGMKGSWFIQALCETLKTHGAKMEFLKLLTLVNKKVAQNFQSNNPDNADYHMMKQISCITTMLTKDLFFNTRKTHRLTYMK